MNDCSRKIMVKFYNVEINYIECVINELKSISFIELN